MTDAEEKPDFPKDAKPWHTMLTEAEKRDVKYHERADRIDKLYARGEAMADSSHDREFQLFWAQIEVLNPTVYSRAPTPVVAPRFRDRKPLPRRAAELVERSLVTDCERDDMHDELKQVRNDMVRLARGAIRVSLVQDDNGISVPADHIFRRDFRHGPARKWKEVPWVGWRGYYTRDEYKSRFGDDMPEGVEFKDHQKEKLNDDETKDFADKKCAVWEIWHKPKRKVVFIAEGAKTISEAIDPPWSLDSFWPLVRPAYGTLKPETLTPIPDVVYYQDQLEEINELTDRIAQLSESLRLKGFYAAGAGDIGSAIELALGDNDNRALMVPVPSFAALGPNATISDAIMWMPIEQVAATIVQCVELRKQLMQDVYEITGLSDIMRGATEAQETLGAQQLKAQFGSVRVKERQGEMQRVARDVFRLKAELMAEQFPPEELLALSQIEDLPQAAELQKQAEQIKQQATQQLQAIMQQAQQMQGQQPQPQQPQQPDPQQAVQQIEQAAQQQLQELSQTVTIDAVMQLLRDERMRPFVLEVETDSTIEPDQMAEKQNRTEFMSALGPMLQQGIDAMQLAPQLGPFLAEAVRFVASGFKVARSMDDAIDELAEGFADYQPPAPEGEDPAIAQAAQAAEAAKAEAAKAVSDAKAQEVQGKLAMMEKQGQQDAQRAQMEMGKMQSDAQTAARKAELDAQKMQMDMVQSSQAHQQQMELMRAQIAKIEADVEAKAQAAVVDQQVAAAEENRAERGFEREGAAGEREMDMAERKTEADIKADTDEKPKPKKRRMKVIRGADGFIEALEQEDVD